MIEIELTMLLPCTHFSPASMTLHLDESIITGTRAMSGSAGNQIQELHHRRFGIEQAFVHIDVDDLGAVFDLLTRNGQGFVVAVFLDQLLELGRAGDIGALADVDEQHLRRDHEAVPDPRRECECHGFDAGNGARRRISYCLGDGADMIRRGAATATDKIH